MGRSEEYGAYWDHFSDKWTDPKAKFLGDEWGATDQIFKEFIEPYLKRDMKVLEIGSGGGRWTERLVNVAGDGNVDAVDCSASMLGRLEFRLGNRVGRILTDGKSLDAVKPERLYDFVFSFDALVHVDLFDIGTMVRQLKDLTTPEAVCVLHHSEVETLAGLEHWLGARKAFTGADTAGNFSVNSSRIMFNLARYFGYLIVTQEPVRAGRDTVTVIRRRP
jgi:ubiquinone/menaquinone biosynthesis C-methylase UbiE